MADVQDLTIEILKQIRDGVAQTNARLDQTREELSAKIDQTNARLDQTNARLDQHERVLVRLVDEVKVHGQAIGKLIHEVEGLNERFDNFLSGAHRDDHEDLRARVAKLEAAGRSRRG